MFADAKRKLRRADQHLANLKGAVQSFVRSKPYAFRIEREAKAGHYLLCGRITRSPRLLWALWIGDFIHNARSALDYAVYAMSTLDPGDQLRQSLQFPICDCPQSYSNACRKNHRLDGVDQAKKDVIEGHQPYQRSTTISDDSLFLLRGMSNVDKHHSLHLVAAAGQHATIQMGPIRYQATGGAVIKLGDWVTIQQVNMGRMSERESIVGRVTVSRGKCNMDPQPSIQVEFGKGEPWIQGRQVVQTLSAIRDRVEETIVDLEEA